ncbi:SET domain-containing protein [Candidatus Woesearchaeota archaeon]|nr:SET domain-containing protein [Candidatus Woesearchaeota archaeon]
MKKYIIKQTKTKGNGLYANKNFKKDELILIVDLSRLKSFTAKQMQKDPKLQSDHCDYVGNQRFVISHHPYSYMNHSCDPNVYVKHLSMKKMKYYAMRNIRKGEELTYDYGANALEGFDKIGWKSFKCACGSKKCRKIVFSNFFKLPKRLQKNYFQYLPPGIKRRYKKNGKI